MPSLTLNIPHGSDREKKLLQRLSARITASEKANNSRADFWRRAEERVLAYVPEQELDSKRRARRDTGKPQYTTLQIPYTYALLMSAHTYLTSVFFARSPVHQYAGRHGEGEQATQAMEALIDYQVSVGGAMGPYYIWLYDALKYGIGILGTYWDSEEVHFSEIQLDPQTGKKIQILRKGPGYEGNRFYNVSPFDFLPDPRVPVGQFQRGEYCAIRRRLSWNDIVRRQKKGYYTNIEALKTSVGTSEPRKESYSALDRPDAVTTFSDGGDVKHPSLVEGFETYVELIPSEWGLDDSDIPQKWVFTSTSDHTVLLGAQPLGLLHNKFPYDVKEIEIEAYGLYNRGIPEIIEPLQDTMDWLVNSHFYNVRAVLNNLFIADPSRIVMKDFENTEPGGVIRLKPEGYGQDLSTMIKQIPVVDITQSHINDLQLIQSFGERALGVNDNIMGALAGGGRKTATEVRTSTGFGVNRLKTISEYLSATAFSEHSQKLVTTTQQFYSMEKKFRIVGSLSQDAGPKFVDVSPESIMGFFDFVPVDGVLPVDRMAQANLWKEILLNVGRVPQVAMQYDLSKIFAWMATIAGLKNISQFRINVMPPGVGPAPGMVPISPGANLPRMPQTSTPATGISMP